MKNGEAYTTIGRCLGAIQQTRLYGANASHRVIPPAARRAVSDFSRSPVPGSYAPMRHSRRPTARGVIVRAEFLRAGTIQELKSKGRLVVRGAHRPIHLFEPIHGFRGRAARPEAFLTFPYKYNSSGLTCLVVGIRAAWESI